MLVDTDTDFSESEALSSLQISGKHDESGEFLNSICFYLNIFSILILNFAHLRHLGTQFHRIETKTAPKPSQPEVVLSDGNFFIFFSFFVCHIPKRLYEAWVASSTKILAHEPRRQ